MRYATLLAVAGLLAAAAPASAAPPVTAISTAGDHACALLEDGTVRCWGANEYGQLGTGARTPRSLTPVVVRGLAGVTAISATSLGTCAVLGTGTVECWGRTVGAQPRPVAGLTNATAVAADYSFACALLADRTVSCWGENTYGQLGNGTRTPSRTPVAVSGIADAIAISAEDSHACALLSNATVSCWGWAGDLGTDRSGDQLTPRPISGVAGAATIDASAYDDCMLLQSGLAACRRSTGAVSVMRRFGRLKAFSFTYDGQQTTHACGVRTNGTVLCQSPFAVFGQLGNGKLVTKSKRPVAVLGIRDATTVSASGFYTCALLRGGGVKCWGANESGQLGDGTRTRRLAPVRVRGL